MLFISFQQETNPILFARWSYDIENVSAIATCNFFCIKSELFVFLKNFNWKYKMPFQAYDDM